MTDHSAAPDKTVFISFSLANDRQVSRFVSRLRDHLEKQKSDLKVVSCLDFQDELPPDWPATVSRYIKEARYVLVACTPEYDRSLSRVPDAPGGGVRAEVTLIEEVIHRDPNERSRFIPIQFGPRNTAHIPVSLPGSECRNVASNTGYLQLLSRLGELNAIGHAQLKGFTFVGMFPFLIGLLISGTCLNITSVVRNQ